MFCVGDWVLIKKKAFRVKKGESRYMAPVKLVMVSKKKNLLTLQKEGDGIKEGL